MIVDLTDNRQVLESRSLVNPESNVFEPGHVITVLNFSRSALHWTQMRISNMSKITQVSLVGKGIFSKKSGHHWPDVVTGKLGWIPPCIEAFQRIIGGGVIRNDVIIDRPVLRPKCWTSSCSSSTLSAANIRSQDVLKIVLTFFRKICRQGINLCLDGLIKERNNQIRSDKSQTGNQVYNFVEFSVGIVEFKDPFGAKSVK